MAGVFNYVKSALGYMNIDEPEVASTDQVMEDGSVPQNKPLDNRQVPNEAGGYVWKVGDMNRLRRFLCLGSEGGTYYIGEKDLGIENAQCVLRLINEGKGVDVVKEVVEFSVQGRAAKQNPIIFVLAFCARQDADAPTKKAAYEALAKVCRIPTHLFSFIEFSQSLSRGHGWGRAHRRAINNWYNNFSEDPKRLAMLVTKYKNRNNWTHRDVFRLCHIKPGSDGVGAVVRYVVKGMEVAEKDFGTETCDEKVKNILAFLQGVEEAKTADENAIIALIKKHHLVREHIPTKLLNSKTVWQTLLHHMPMTALIRNLGKMSAIEILQPGSKELETVILKMSTEEALKTARIHPFNILVALQTFKKGKGDKGKLKWNANEDVVQALDNAFYMSFKYVEPTNQRYLLAVDVSGSMGWGGVNGNNSITPHVASAAMAMVTLRSETTCDIMGFSDKLVPLDVNKAMDLKEVLKVMEKVPMGGTDCALPMLWARAEEKKYDVFIVYTDCETWAGKTHPAEAIRLYRQTSGIWNAKVIVVGMTSNGFTLADPEDPGMMDMAGFDSAAPEVMRNFVLGML